MNGLIVRFNSDTSANYARHFVGGDGASASSSAVASGTNAGLGYFPGSSDPANVFGVVVWDILDYTSVSKNKTSRNLWGSELNNTSGNVGLYSSLWFKTPEAITTITIAPGAGNWAQYSQLALYGIK